MRAALLLTALAASSARAEPPATEFIAARITVSSGAAVILHRYKENDRSVPAPARTMDVYVWREGAPPLALGAATAPRDLLSPGQNDLAITSFADAFEVSVPSDTVIVTGDGPMRIDPAVIRKVTPARAPLHGRRPRAIVPVSARDAKLLRGGPPAFHCALGRDRTAERTLLSWRKGRETFASVCSGRASKKALEALSREEGVVILEVADDSVPEPEHR